MIVGETVMPNGAGLRRSLWSYGKVQRFVSRTIRGRSQFYNPMKAPVFLDLGPGENLSPEFYNVDWSWRPGIDRCMDITHGLQLGPSSLLGVYSEHCFEHLPVDATVRILKELHAAMVENAWLRVSMPDLELYARQYVKSLDSGSNSMPYSDSVVAGLKTPAIPLNNVVRLHGHVFVYDFETFSCLLKNVGFRNVHREQFRHGAVEKLLRDSEHRRCESFYVEAQK